MVVVIITRSLSSLASGTFFFSSFLSESLCVCVCLTPELREKEEMMSVASMWPHDNNELDWQRFDSNVITDAQHGHTEQRITARWFLIGRQFFFFLFSFPSHYHHPLWVFSFFFFFVGLLLSLRINFLFFSNCFYRRTKKTEMMLAVCSC
jgi:hypothetical protein